MADPLLLKLLEQQAGIRESVARIEENLEEHMRRTANLEGRTDQLQLLHSKNKSSIDMAVGAIALLSVISAVLSILIGLGKILA